MNLNLYKLSAKPPVCALLILVAAQVAAAEIAPDCSRKAGSLPTPENIPIEHIVVIVQENHSFDNYFGKLNSPEFYGSELDGLTPSMSNLNLQGIPVFSHHENSLCEQDTRHNWNAIHADWDFGKNDGFASQNDETVMGYYNDRDLPYYYALANHFAVADRFFSSVLAQTFPNRFYIMTGTSFGHVRNNKPHWFNQFSQKTIFDVLDQHGVSWKYYRDGMGYLPLFIPLFLKDHSKMKKIKDYQADLQNGKLPSVVFVDARSDDGQDEHPHANIQIGQAWSAARLQEFMQSPYWKNSVLFFTYDEAGGFYDHVPPPAACVPDSIAPIKLKTDVPGEFDRCGFRVPFVAISPFVKHHYVSHVTYDHTSILKFIETKFNLPALTARDANADAMMDLFDFDKPDFEIPQLPEAPIDSVRNCR